MKDATLERCHLIAKCASVGGGREVGGVGWFVNPYGQPDHKKKLFFMAPLIKGQYIAFFGIQKDDER